MRLLVITLLLSFCNFQSETLNKVILGKWEICSNSFIDNPPTFLNCRFLIVFDQSGQFSVYETDNEKLIGRGMANLTYDSTVNEKKLYRLNLRVDSEYAFKIEKYFPDDCIIYISSDSVIFLADNKKDLISPYFLKK